MYLVKKINYIDGYKISLTFNNKKTKLVDIEPYLTKGVFLPLRDPDYFKQVCLSGNTIVWPNEADFCPDVLYEIGVDIHEEGTQLKSPVRRQRKKSAEIKRKAYAMKKERNKKPLQH
jgi:hypothetical protein